MSRVLKDPGSLQIERLPDGQRKLLRDLKVDVSRAMNGINVITVHSGFKTDYSSLPYGTRWVINWVRVDVAGVVHDYLYRNPKFSRIQADWIWYRLARAGVTRANAIQGLVGWIALVLFGWPHKASDGWMARHHPTATANVNKVYGVGARAVGLGGLLWIPLELIEHVTLLTQLVVSLHEFTDRLWGSG